MNQKIYLLVIVFAISISSFSQSTTDTVLIQGHNDGTWISYDATIIHYNDDCQVTESNNYYLNGHRWDTIRRNLYVYDTEERLAELTRQRWSTSIYRPGWQNEYKNLYLYSNDGLADTLVWQNWTFLTNDYYWRNDTREIHQYNIQGLPVYIEGNYYDQSQQIWIRRERTYNTYDNSNHLLNTLKQVWSNNHWVNNYKTQTFYQGDSALTYTYLWNAGTQQWDKVNKEFSDQLGNTTKVETRVQQFLYENAWTNSLKEINQYNTDSLIINNTYQGWDGLQWVNSSRTKTSYYSNNVVKRTNFDIYSSTNNSWEQYNRTLYTNHGCAIGAALVPVNKPETKTAGILRRGQSYSYVFTNGQTGVQHGYQFILTTGNQPKAINTAKQSATRQPVSGLIQMYPNPAKNYFTVDVNEAGSSFITITNLSGKPLLHQPLRKGNQKINISFLQKGFYIVSINANGKMKNQKLLVE